MTDQYEGERVAVAAVTRAVAGRCGENAANNNSFHLTTSLDKHGFLPSGCQSTGGPDPYSKTAGVVLAAGAVSGAATYEI